MAVLYLAVQDDFDAVLAEVVLGVVAGLVEAELDQELGLEIVWNVTNWKDGNENHCLDAGLISNVLFVFGEIRSDSSAATPEVKLRH